MDANAEQRPRTGTAITQRHRPQLIRGRTAEEIQETLINSVYATIGNPGGWSDFIEALAGSYWGGKGLVAVHDTTLRASRAQAGGGWEPDLYEAYNRDFVFVNPWVPSLDKRPVGRVVPAEFMLPRADLLRTQFFADFLRPARLDSGVGVTVQRDRTRHMIVSVLFPHAAAERDADAIGRLQRLMPHLLRAAQLHRQLAGIEARAAATEDALGRLATATLVVAGDGRILYANEMAERLLRTDEALDAVGGRLMVRDRSAGRRLAYLIHSAVDRAAGKGDASGGMVMIPRGDRLPLTALVAPFPPARDSLGLEAPGAILFIRDPEASSPAAAALQGLFGLTLAEARIASALAQGRSLQEIASAVGISVGTARSQLKSIFLKTSTSRQAELVALVLTSAAMLGGK